MNIEGLIESNSTLRNKTNSIILSLGQLRSNISFSSCSNDHSRYHFMTHINYIWVIFNDSPVFSAVFAHTTLKECLATRKRKQSNRANARQLVSISRRLDNHRRGSQPLVSANLELPTGKLPGNSNVVMIGNLRYETMICRNVLIKYFQYNIEPSSPCSKWVRNRPRRVLRLWCLKFFLGLFE